jgi:hypothetical protein
MTLLPRQPHQILPLARAPADRRRDRTVGGPPPRTPQGNEGPSRSHGSRRRRRDHRLIGDAGHGLATPAASARGPRVVDRILHRGNKVAVQRGPIARRNDKPPLIGENLRQLLNLGLSRAAIAIPANASAIPRSRNRAMAAPARPTTTTPGHEIGETFMKSRRVEENAAPLLVPFVGRIQARRNAHIRQVYRGEIR